MKTRVPAPRWIAFAMVVVVALSAVGWWSTREVLPPRIRIATAVPGGLYQRYAETLRRALEERTGRPVELVPTDGSVENRELLLEGEAELALVQASSVDLTEVAVLAPLYPEPVHVIVRADSEVQELAQLDGKAVALGRAGAGMRQSALLLLAHYGLDAASFDTSERYFMELEDDPRLEAAIVTTGLCNPDLMRLLGSGRWRLLPIRRARAIAMQDYFFEAFTIPRGFFGTSPALPPDDLFTLATSALLAAPADVGSPLVDAALDSLYASDLRPQLPLLMPERDVLDRTLVPLHPAAEEHLDPYGGLSHLTNFIESLAGLKELVFGFAAIGYLIWDRSRRLRERRAEADFVLQKERLDALLERTIQVERSLMKTRDVGELERLLDRVTLLKLEALNELTSERLRGDQMFSIYLTQCANLIRKLQGKILQLGQTDGLDVGA